MEESSSVERKKLSYFQFVWTTFLLTSAGPFGFEYTVVAVGVGYSLLLISLFALFYALPIALISSELSGLMPSRHGQIVWPYRAFYKLNPHIGDFIGYINAVNVVIFWAVSTASLPIILIEYLTTITGPFSSLATYFIKLSVILSGLILNTFNISITAYITSFLSIAMILPFFIAFIWSLPDINPSVQWVPCSNNWALAITTCIWEFSGFESLGNLVHEIKFKPNRLFTAYSLAILIDVIVLYLPILSSAALTSNECTAWFDGYFSVSYAQLATSLEYSVAIGSVVINWCVYVSAIAVVSRMVWATAQPYFEITSDGRMLTSMSGIFDAGTTGIIINILPKKFIGELSERTGSAIYAVIAITLFVALTNIYLDFDQLVEFNIFTYFVQFIIELMAYLMLKHVEPNAPRTFEIPFGKVGGWITVITLLIALGICFFIMVIDDATLFGVAVIMNVGLTGYYFLSKWFCHRMYQPDILPNYKFEEDDDDEIKFDDHHDEYCEIQPLI